MKYYDGTKLLSLKDINGELPEIYICTSNRSAGKTTYFSRLLVNKFLKNKEKFAILYRYNYELDDCADKFYKDIASLFFHGTSMTSARKAKGIYHDLFIDDVHCGYALSLNAADQLKKYSHMFSDIKRIMFDEFQSESDRYLSGEVRKFISLHTSIARGQGKQYRYVPVYMISNPVSILNPYYTSLGISSIIQPENKFLRGVGYVLEQGHNTSASNAQKESAFNKAFNSDYIDYSIGGKYLNDNDSFIEKPEGASRYLATLKCYGVNYGIRDFYNLGMLYCDDSPDLTNPNKLAITTEDHQINYNLIKSNSIFITSLKNYFEQGRFRFKDLACKKAIITALSY